MAFCSKVALRTLSLSRVSQAQAVKAPMQVYGVDGRYATALYVAASKQNTLDAINTELQSIHKIYNEDAKFRTFVCDPSISRKVKQSAVVDALKRLKKSDVMQNFMGTVAENGRMGKLEGIFAKFDLLMSAHRGEVQCEVTTAKPLDSSATKELNTALQSFVKQGQKINISFKVDSEIMGGMIVTVGDKYVDMSIASKLRQYTDLINEPV